MNSQNSSTEKPAKEVCPLCRGTGWEFYTQDGYDYARECKCGLLKKRNMEAKLSFANIPDAFKELTLDTFDINVYERPESRKRAGGALIAVKHWIDQSEEMLKEGSGLYLYSDTKGSGKTRMAASIANHLICDKHISVKFATSMQIINEIRATWSHESEEESESKLLKDLIEVPVLVIDDFGVEQVKEWVAERFYHVINDRYVKRKSTIFTSNMLIDDLPYDDRIKDRIYERAFQIPFPEESVRKTIASRKYAEFLGGVKGKG